MNTEKRYVQLPLTTLIEILEGEGFRIDIDLRIKLQKVLYTFSEEILKKKSEIPGEEINLEYLDELKYYIRPLIAKSHNQQIVFDSAFEKYLRYIESKTIAFEQKLSDSDREQQIDGSPKWNFKKYKTTFFFSLGVIAFLLFVYFMNLAREKPGISMLVDTKWISVGDSLTIEGQVNGIFIESSILINDSLNKSEKFAYPENDIISITKKFNQPGIYEVKLSARNLFTANDTSKTISFNVCAYKPKIDFVYEIDLLNPLKVFFTPEIAIDTSMDYSISMKSISRVAPYEEILIFKDGRFVHEFKNPDTYHIELSAKYIKNDPSDFDSICDISTISKIISLKSVILGEKKQLVKADPNKGLSDSLNNIEDQTSKLMVGIISYKNREELSETFIPLFDSVVSLLDNYRELDFSFFNEEQELSNLLLEGKLDIGVYTVFPYLEAAIENPELTVFATHQIDGRVSYQGYIITRKSDGIYNLKDLKGKRFTFVKPTSTSGFKLPKGIFQIRGYSVDNGFFEYDFSGDHLVSINLLLDGKTDAIAIDESRWLVAGRQGKDTTSLKKIEEYEVLYNAYVLSPKLTVEKKDSIKSVMIDSIRIAPDNPLRIEKLISVKDDHYDEHRRHLNMSRRKPGFKVRSIEIDEEISKYDTLLYKSIEDSIYSLVWKTARFTDNVNTNYNFIVDLKLDNANDKRIRYDIFLNKEFIGTGEIDINNVKTKGPRIFVNDILNALPVETNLMEGDSGKMFVTYGKMFGLNLEDYAYIVDGDTIPEKEINQTDNNTYFTKLEPTEDVKSVRIAYLSTNTNTTQYFNIFKWDSWKRSSTLDLILLLSSIVFLLILPLLGLEFFYFRRRKIIPSQQIASSLQFDGIKAPYELELPNQNKSIYPEKELFDLSRILKHRREAGILQIDIFKSIKKSAQNAGFIKLYFKEKTKVPEYLIIVDRSSAEGFHINLFGYLNDFLQNEDTLLDVFYFSNSPRYLRNEQYPEGISLEDISEKYPHHILLIISDGKKLINTKMDRIFRWASDVLPKWDKRFILTPRSYSAWDRNEEIINECLPILPATLKGLLYMSESLSEQELPDLKKRIADLKLSGDASFYSDESINGIKEFLNDPLLFQWFCCLAIYPKIHWQFVVAIGKAIAEKNKVEGSDFSINYESLYKISEVSHLLESNMDDDLRIGLMNSLDTDIERIARQAILDLLNELKIPEDSYLYREVMVQSKVNYSLLNQDDKQATKDLFYLWQNNLIEDRAIKSYLSESNSNLWNKKADDFFSHVNYLNWKQLLFRRVPIYLLATFLILMIFNVTLFQNIIKPENPTLDIKSMVTEIKSDSTSKKLISYAAILNNKAVDVYNSGQVDSAESLLDLASIRDNSLNEIRKNYSTIAFNKAIDYYLSGNFNQAIKTLLSVEGSIESKDSIEMDALHYLGLSYYYLNDSKQAKSLLSDLKELDSFYLDQYYPNLETLLNLETPLSVTEPNPCDKYSNYSAYEWRRNFLKITADRTWHVFVSSLGSETTQKEAENFANKFREKHKNLDFNIMSTISSSGKSNFQYAIVLAEGLESESLAREIASFANSCGIAQGAYAQQQKLSNLVDPVKTQSISKLLDQKQDQEFKGHTDAVSSVAFSPDGKTILTGSDDRTARLWDLNGEMIQEYKGHTDGIRSVAFSPDGNTILTGSADKTARLWDLKGEMLQEFKGHTGVIRSVAFSPDGKTILTGSRDKTARLWGSKGNMIEEFKGHTGYIHSIAFSPDGKTILTGSGDQTARLWDLKGEMIEEFKGHTGVITTVAFSPDGKTMLTGSRDQTARLWNLRGDMLQEFKAYTNWIASVAFSPDSKTILTGSGDQTARLWNLRGGMNEEFKGHTDVIFSVAFSPDGKTILTGSGDKTARLWTIKYENIQINDFENIKQQVNKTDGSQMKILFISIHNQRAIVDSEIRKAFSHELRMCLGEMWVQEISVNQLQWGSESNKERILKKIKTNYVLILDFTPSINGSDREIELSFKLSYVDSKYTLNDINWYNSDYVLELNDREEPTNMRRVAAELCSEIDFYKNSSPDPMERKFRPRIKIEISSEGIEDFDINAFNKWLTKILEDNYALNQNYTFYYSRKYDKQFPENSVFIIKGNLIKNKKMDDYSLSLFLTIEFPDISSRVEPIIINTREFMFDENLEKEIVEKIIYALDEKNNYYDR